MKYQYIPYIWLLFASTLLSLSLGLFTILRRRNAKGATSFILSMFVVATWSAANAFEMSGMDFSTKLFWANIQYFAFCYSPVTLLALCMQFSGYDSWIKSKKILWVAVIPTIIIILVWTDKYHGLVRYNMHLDYSGQFPVIDKEYGVAFYIHAIYSHTLNILAWVLLIKAILYRKSVYKKQTITLFIGVGLIVVPNVLYILGLSPIKRFDITPVFFGPAGLIMYWGIFRLKMFDLVPLARATVIETMDAGVMVLDLQDHILDINPACANILDMPVSQITTGRVENALSKIPELVKACTDRSITYTEFSMNSEKKQKIYEVILSPLNNKKGILLGRLAVIYDITEKKHAQQELLKQQWKLAVIDERERMARDMHDNLGQVLGFINLQAQGIRQELINTGVVTAAGRLDKLVEVTQSTHNEIREFIRNIRNSSEKDFISTLQKDILNFEKQTGYKIELMKSDSFTGEELRPNVSINILNIVRESLNNIRKHAGAKHVKLSFSITEKQLCVMIEDDGKGFEFIQNKNEHKYKFGLDIMCERATEIGGQIQIESTVGKGCRVILLVPLEGNL